MSGPYLPFLGKASQVKILFFNSNQRKILGTHHFQSSFHHQTWLNTHHQICYKPRLECLVHLLTSHGPFKGQLNTPSPNQCATLPNLELEPSTSLGNNTSSNMILNMFKKNIYFISYYVNQILRKSQILKARDNIRPQLNLHTITKFPNKKLAHNKKKMLEPTPSNVLKHFLYIS